MKHLETVGCIFTVFALLVGGAWGAESQVGPADQSDIFVSGKEGYRTYRIPAIVVSNKGTVLAFCEGRTAGDTGDINMVLKRSTDGGKTFGPMQVIWDDAKNTCGNCCPVVDRKTGTIHLLMTWNLGTDH
ncbi:MAG: exo-alpha-sialidase, partial [Phycisphaerales bacterium]|nr:exo-alpha-sialidase [Phycisphaerales bacterium]